MPSLLDLEQFRASFRAVGGEISTLASRGESYSDMDLPVAPEEASMPPKEEGAGVDFGAFLDSIPDDLASPVDEGAIPEDLLSGFADEIEAERNHIDSGFGGFDLPAVEDVFELPPEDAVAADGRPEETPDFDAVPDFSEESGDAIPFEAPEEPAPQDAEADDSFSLFSEEPEAEALPDLEEESFDFSIPEFEGPGKLPVASEKSSGAGPAAVEITGSGFDDEAASDISGIDETPLDSFDTFTLDDSAFSAGFGLSETKGGGEGANIGRLEEFSLAGIDDVFGGGPAVPPPPITGRRPAGGRAAAAAVQEVEEIRLSEEDFSRLEETLASYPLNLRIACEELIAEQAVAPDLMSSLVKALVRGASAKETASLAGKILGRTIVIPRGFEKRTGEELEAEQATFSYAFVHQFLPIFRMFAFIAAVAASLVYLGFEFVYTPLRAESLYRQGYERIGAGEYERANERFRQAFAVKRKKGWFYTYAEAFRDKRQFIQAQAKYDELLRYYPRDKKGVLDYAAMESEYLRNYAKADRLIRNNILDYSVDDKEGLLALGDVNLAWGDLDPSRYEEARKAFARLMERYGRQDPYLERMLTYFIRTDNIAEVLVLQGHFMSSPRTRIRASGLAEMGGYLLEKKLQEVRGVPDENISKIEGLRELFDRAIRLDPAHPESHYHLAKYFNRFGNPAEEQRTLERALRAFEAAPELSARRVGYRIDAHRRLALLLKDNKEFISAEEQLVGGLSLYEDAVDRRILVRSEQFGRLYSDLADIEYFNGGDLAVALGHYRNARLNGWAPPEVQYRVGAAHYFRREWTEAVESFFESSNELPLNRRLLFSLGNASYMRGNLHAAQGYYNRLLDMLEAERSRFPMLVPNDRPDHLELAERIMRARNNLGVALEALADRTGDARLRSRALALYAESARAWDALTRDPVSMVRSASANLAYLNTRNSLYPERGYEPQLYMEIDKDVLEPSPWEELLGR